ncbi:oligosaccharide flippase family protein [Spiribacter roseus]|uniref:Oligosaccharide flippase family protein n=1 Tax=Spiribacter roseus TaxID=1855875 RepID=A0ABV3S0U3_9GAMM
MTRLATGSVIRRNISMTLGRQILAAVAQLLLVVLIARNLGPAGNGHYAMAILLPTLLVNFLNLGVGPATVYHVGRGAFSARQAASENLRLGVMIASAGAVVAVPVVLIWGERLFPGVPQSLLWLGLAAFPISLLLAYLNTVLQGLEDFRAFNATALLPPYVTLVGVAASLHLFDTGVVGAVAAYLGGQAAGLVLVGTLLLRRTQSVDASDVWVSGRDYRRQTVGYGWKAHLSNILAFVNYRADIFLVNFFLNPAATGLYVVAVQIAERLWMLSQAASTVLLPRMSAMHTDPAARLALTGKAFVAVSTLTAAASAVTATALYWLLRPIFGDEYWAALPAFLWLLPGIVAGAGARVQSNCIAAAGKPEWNMYVAVGVVSLNVVGNILLVPTYGIIGAAWATSGAYVLNAIVKGWLVHRTCA